MQQITDKRRAKQIHSQGVDQAEGLRPHSHARGHGGAGADRLPGSPLFSLVKFHNINKQIETQGKLWQ